MSYSMQYLFHTHSVNLTPVEKYMSQVTQQIRLNNLRVPSLNYLNQYINLASLTGPSKMQLPTDTKLILERSYNPLSWKENGIEII